MLLYSEYFIGLLCALPTLRYTEGTAACVLNSTKSVL